jgi:hypothetical protein
LTEDEKRKGLLKSQTASIAKSKDYSQLRVSPNSPLAAQIVEDKVIDMHIFLTLRYFKNFDQWKSKRVTEIEKDTQSILKHQQSQSVSVTSKRKSVKLIGDDSTERAAQYQAMN